SPLGRWGLLHPSSWRRLHRKLCVVDQAVAFCGGINILDDLHDPNHGTLESPRLDFSVRVSGPLVAQVHEAMVQLWQRMKASGTQPSRLRGLLFSRYVGSNAQAAAQEAAPMAGGVHAGLVLRDNLRHRARIEQAYRREIGRAREEIVIANAYFVPGRKMRQALIRAAQRGVRVQLLLQGRYEYFLQYYGARPVYGSLLRAGIEIHEYAPSFLHAKVAVIDGRWATVGSSNLDPLSLLLAREANVMVHDAVFAQLLRQALLAAIRDHGVALDPKVYAARSLAQRARERVALVLMRLALALQGHKYL
ncbi:MAG: cardiolipin synthase ClsB, partial [Comamonadaceae bacterium]